MKLFLGLMAALLFGLAPGLALASGVQVWPMPLGRGCPAMVTAKVDGLPTKVTAHFLGQTVTLQKGAKGRYYGAVAAPLDAPLGPRPLRVFVDSHQVTAVDVRVVAMDYGVRQLTVHKKYDDMTPEDLEKYKKDTARITAVYAMDTPRRYWSGQFERPVPGVVVSKFGRRSVVNGVEKAPHSGVDLRGAKGDPVKATAAGQVVLALDHYFGGNTLMIDHGQGVVSRYLHLSAILVKEGQYVDAGQVVGLVGATGRVTGPHLDFGVGLNGVRIDPLAWLELSRRLGAALEGK